MTKSDAIDFEFLESGGQVAAERGVVVKTVRLQSGITRKRKLLAALAATLDFPDYFGHNWDALEECLADLSWYKDAKVVRLVHADLPCAENAATLATYLDILRNRLQAATPANGVKLRVCFPMRAKTAVQSALKTKI